MGSTAWMWCFVPSSCVKWFVFYFPLVSYWLLRALFRQRQMELTGVSCKPITNAGLGGAPMLWLLASRVSLKLFDNILMGLFFRSSIMNKNVWLIFSFPLKSITCILMVMNEILWYLPWYMLNNTVTKCRVFFVWKFLYQSKTHNCNWNTFNLWYKGS